MAVTQQMLEALVAIIADYREGEIARPDAAHIQRWVNQFEEPVRELLLTELTHVLSKTYISKKGVQEFLAALIHNKNLSGETPREFWLNAKFLNIQKRGNSQRELTALFAAPLKTATGLDLAQCGTNPACYIYLDDGIFTGMTIIDSLRTWIKGDAPNEATVHVIVIAGHAGGQYYASQTLAKVMAEANKKISLHWWALVRLDDRRINTDNSDVLRPTVLPDDARVQAYAAGLSHPPVLRNPGKLGDANIFSSEQGRNHLEQQLLVKGAYIREIAPRLPKFARPLGDMVLEALGFGSTFVTFRNCPNNTPLAFWVGNPWYPLFPRKTN